MCYFCVLSTAELLSCAAVAKFILCVAAAAAIVVCMLLLATAATGVCYWCVRMLLVYAAVLSEY